jgi:glycerophosphoryl diester phosphodiesterase
VEAFPEARLNIEIKGSNDGVHERLVSRLRRLSVSDRVLVAAREHDTMERLRSLGEELPTGFSKEEIREFLRRVSEGAWEDYRPAGVALQVPEVHGPHRVVSPEFVEQAHGIGIEVHVWTINEPADMVRLLDWGVDGIMTDNPALALASVEALGRSKRHGCGAVK